MNDTVDLGDGHVLTFAAYRDDPRTGASVAHKKPDGTDCDGWIAFTGGAWARSFQGDISTWDVLSKEPLTLSPSILCRACGDHGFIRNGRWERA